MEILTIISLIASLYALYKISKIDERIKNLQSNIHASQPTHTDITLDTPPSPTENIHQLNYHEHHEEKEKQGFLEEFFAWIQVDWPLKIGALLIILAFVWLVTYAFLNNWIGPVGRITIGIIAGSGIMAFGNHWFTKSWKQGHVLVGAGASIMLISIAAAQFTYEMFPPIVALSLSALVMILMAGVSIQHNSRSLAAASLIIGGLAPLLTNSPEASVFGLYSYLLVLCAGVLWLTHYKQWQFLTPLALILVSLYSFEYFGSTALDLKMSLRPLEFLQLKFFAITFTALFFGTSLTGTLNKEKIKPTLTTALLVGLFALGWVNGVVQPHNKGIITALVAISFATAAYMNFTVTRVKESVYVFTAIAVILMAVATGYQFDGPTLVIALAMQAAILPIFAHKYLSKDLGYSMLLYHILPVFASFESWASGKWECYNYPLDRYTDTWTYAIYGARSLPYCTTEWWSNASVFHADFFALLIVTASLLVTGYYFYHRKKSEQEEHNTRLHNAGVILIIAGAIYALALVWRVLTAGMADEDTARMITLIIYTVVGLGLYVNGQIHKRMVRNRFGLVLLLLVIGRLLLVEVRDMDIAGRIVTFFLIGILLMGSVLVRKGLRSR